MLIRIGYDISFELANPTPLITMLYVHPSRRKDLRAAEEITVAPDVPVHTYQDSFGNICGRLLAPAGTVRFTLDIAIEDSGQPDAESPEAAQHSIEDLPDEALRFFGRAEHIRRSNRACHEGPCRVGRVPFGKDLAGNETHRGAGVERQVVALAFDLAGNLY